MVGGWISWTEEIVDDEMIGVHFSPNLTVENVAMRKWMTRTSVFISKLGSQPDRYSAGMRVSSRSTNKDKD